MLKNRLQFDGVSDTYTLPVSAFCPNCIYDLCITGLSRIQKFCRFLFFVILDCAYQELSVSFYGVSTSSFYRVCRLLIYTTGCKPTLAKGLAISIQTLFRRSKIWYPIRSLIRSIKHPLCLTNLSRIVSEKSGCVQCVAFLFL